MKAFSLLLQPLSWIQQGNKSWMNEKSCVDFTLIMVFNGENGFIQEIHDCYNIWFELVFNFNLDIW